MIKMALSLKKLTSRKSLELATLKYGPWINNMGIT